MKQAKTYETKIRKLLKQMPKSAKVAKSQETDTVREMLLSILEANSTRRKASQALVVIEQECVDFNDLRVAPIKDITDVVGNEYPGIHDKVEMIKEVLGNIFARTSNISLEFPECKSRRELQRMLTELGLDEYATALMLLKVFGLHAVPVDLDLAETLIMDDMVHKESNISSIQTFLEHLVPQKKSFIAHEFFRALVKKRSNALARKREAEAKARAEAEEKARVEAEAKAKALAEAEAEAERKAAKKAAEKETAAKAREEKKTAAKKAKKAKETAAKKAKKTKNKTAKKAVVKKKAVTKKAVKKTKKTAAKKVKKTARSASKTVKKKAKKAKASRKRS